MQRRATKMLFALLAISSRKQSEQIVSSKPLFVQRKKGRKKRDGCPVVKLDGTFISLRALHEGLVRWISAVKDADLGKWKASRSLNIPSISSWIRSQWKKWLQEHEKFPSMMSYIKRNTTFLLDERQNWRCGANAMHLQRNETPICRSSLACRVNSWK